MFLDLPKEKQVRLHGIMVDLFTKLEAEWRANPENQGKPLSYVNLWEEFLARQGDCPDKYNSTERSNPYD